MPQKLTSPAGSGSGHSSRSNTDPMPAQKRSRAVESARADKAGMQQKHTKHIPHHQLRVEIQEEDEDEDAIVPRRQDLQQTPQERHCGTEVRDRQIQELNPQEVIQKLQEENQHLRQELDKLTRKSLSWKTCKAAPWTLKRGSSTVCGSVAYFRPAFRRQVLSYNSDTKQWSTVPDCPTESFTFTVVNGLVTAVGGQLSHKYTNTLFSLVEEGRKWVEHFPRMPTKRELPGVVFSGKALVVAGGEGEGYTRLTTVEVLNTDTRQWSVACNLPDPLSGASTTLCEGKIYIGAGWGQPGYSITSVFSCSLSTLLQSQIVETTFSRAENHSVWLTVNELPVKSSTFVTFNGQLLAVGGYTLCYSVHTHTHTGERWRGGVFWTV